MNIQNAIKTFYQAVTENDKQVLEQILSDKLTYGHSAGLIDTKESLISDITTNKSRFTKVNLSNEEIIVVRDDIVTVRHRMQGDFLTNNQFGGNADLGVMQVWYANNNKWVLFARQAFKWT